MTPPLSPSSSTPAGSGVGYWFRALKHRNFRLFFIGQTISFVGTWMQSTALGWLVWRLTHNPNMLGTVVFFAQIPVFLLGPAAGYVADHFNRHKALLVTQTLLMIQALLLALLVLMDWVRAWEIIPLAVFLGTATAFDLPLRQSFYIHMVGKDDLGNAIALNSIMANGSRMFGPSLAGILMLLPRGDGICFLINGISYIGALWALLAMRHLPPHEVEPGGSFLRGVNDGFKYALRSVPIRSLLLIAALVSVAGMPYVTLMPMIADTVLHGNAHTYGWLVAVAGVGTFCGSLFLITRRGVAGLDRAVAVSTILFGVGIVGFGLSHWIWISRLCLIVIGYGFIAQIGSCNTIIQTIVSEQHRGRIMSFFTMAFLGVSPFGSLAAGYLAHRIGVQETLVIGGLLCLVGGVTFAALLPKMRLLEGALPQAEPVRAAVED